MNKIANIWPKIMEATTNEKVSNHQRISKYQVIFDKINLNITSGMKILNIGLNK